MNYKRDEIPYDMNDYYKDMSLLVKKGLKEKEGPISKRFKELLRIIIGIKRF